MTSLPAPWPRRLVGLLVLMGLACALYVFAALLVRLHLDHAAQHTMGRLKDGKTPWHWQFEQPDDLIAGRVFGSARLRRSAHGLEIRSQDGSRVEVGFPIDTPLDLRRGGILQLQFKTTGPRAPHLDIRVMPQLLGASCQAALPDRPDGRWRLDQLDWRGPPQAGCSPPHAATLLRLGIRQRAGDAVILHAARLLPTPGLHAPDPRVALAIAPDPDRLGTEIKALASTPLTQWPLARLPSRAGPQRQLALRDAIRARAPGSIVLGPDAMTTTMSVHIPGSSWVVLALYAVALVLLEWHRASVSPMDRMLLSLDVLAAVFGLLWLIAGLHLGPGTALPDILVAGLGGLFALRLARIRLPGAWSWWGHWRDYAAPFAPLVILLPLLLTYGHAYRVPSASSMAIYLGWAVIQQALMLVVVLRRLEWIARSNLTAILACALLFALMHTPNARLMVLCLAAEAWWGIVFLRRRALLPIALAHAFFALALQAGLAGGWLRSLEVGARYFMTG